MTRCGLPFLIVVTLLGPALAQDRARGEVTFDRYGPTRDRTFLEADDGRRLELVGDHVASLRRFRAPDLGLGSDVSLQVELEGQLDGSLFWVRRVMSPGPLEELLVRVERDGEIHAHLGSERLRVLGPFAGDVLERVDGKHATVRGFRFEAQGVLFVLAVRATVRERTTLYRVRGFATATFEVRAGRASKGAVWVRGHSVGPLYLADDERDRYVREVDLNRLDLVAPTPRQGEAGGLAGAVSSSD